MITKEMVQLGIDTGLVTFVVDPNRGKGTVCQIGDRWFYFAQWVYPEHLTTRNEWEMEPEEFLKTVPLNEIIEEIVATLEDFSRDESLDDEARYYEAVLEEAFGGNLSKTDDRNRLAQEVEQLKAERDAAVADLASLMAELRGNSFCGFQRIRSAVCANETCHFRGGNSPCKFIWRGVQKCKEVVNGSKQ